MLRVEEKKILLDMAAYIIWSVNHDNGYFAVLGNVGHDCIGLLNREPCLLPRTDGYQEALASDFGIKVGG